MKAVKSLLTMFALWTMVGLLSKPLFLVWHVGLADGITLGDWLGVMWYGLRLDLAVAGYISAFLALMLGGWLIVSQKVKRSKGQVVENSKIRKVEKSESQRVEKSTGFFTWWRWTWRIFIVVFSSVYSLAITANLFLYPYWGFPLDTTSLFYLTSSPADAMASITAGQMVLSGGVFLLLTVLLSWCFLKASKWCGLMGDEASGLSSSSRLPNWQKDKRIIEPILFVLLLAALFIPIRGGFSTATNNTGSVYFSTNMLLNHAAVNPVFSFLESATEERDLDKKFRYMDDDEATRLFNEMCYTQLRGNQSVDSPLQDALPLDSSMAVVDSISLTQQEDVNVVVIVLESFSHQIMSEAGKVKGVIPNFEALSHEGLYFTNFYANSFRTDRGLVSILSGYPAQPDMSIMKETHKTAELPSIARSLHGKGYSTAYYYGGDANFTNMRSYVMQTGFDRLISDTDFPATLRVGKWGVQDEHLFRRALDDMKQESGTYYKVIQTLSSHEPFEVPYKSRFEDPSLNAFAYTDHHLGDFIKGMKELPSWKRTLVVLVPDHLGCYPQPLDNYQPWRYQIPLVMVGGVVERAQRVNVIGMQTDLAATLLGLLGIDHSDFTFSKDLLDPQAPHYAFFDAPGVFGMVTDTCSVVYDYQSEKIANSEGKGAQQQLRRAQAYVQKLYDDIAKR